MIFASNNKIIPGFGFARTRDKAFGAIRKLWRQREAEGWTQADLAEKLSRDPAWVSRKLSGPTNWTLRTFGELTDAMDGEVEIEIYDLNAPAPLRNHDAYAGYHPEPDDVVRIDLTQRRMSDSGTSVKTNTVFVQ